MQSFNTKNLLLLVCLCVGVTSSYPFLDSLFSNHMSDSNKGKEGGQAFNPADLSLRPKPPTVAKPVDDGFDSPPRSWPDLVGTPGEHAKQVITTDLPGLNVIVLPKDSMVTRDYRLDRVRVFVDDEGKVASVPSQG